ncbi:MAG: hypothetical protein UHX00_13005 [Caryophanon sp.]|nr:hypothetical protein [Caryophanon sp.]
MAKALIAIGAATVNVLTKWLQTEEQPVQIVWIGSHQQDFLSLKVRDYIGDIVSETKEHVVGTRGELLYIASGQTFEQQSADQQRLERILSKYDDFYILSSLGGGTTSHVTPFIAELCTKKDSLMQAIVTLPAKLEPRTRHEKAQYAFHQLKQICPVIHLVTNNGEHEESLVATFARRDELLATLLTRLIR